MFSEKEREFLHAHPICRLATVSENGLPHNVPVGFAFDGQYFYTTTDPGTKKLKNLKLNNKVCLVVDVPEKPRRAIMVQGEAELIEKGEAFREAIETIVRLRGRDWGATEGEQIAIKIKTSKKISWGLA